MDPDTGKKLEAALALARQNLARAHKKHRALWQAEVTRLEKLLSAPPPAAPPPAAAPVAQQPPAQKKPHQGGRPRTGCSHPYPVITVDKRPTPGALTYLDSTMAGARHPYYR